MKYEECDFDDLEQCAELYGLSLKTARTWAGKSVEAVPWRDPQRVLVWYRVAFQREPNKRVRERCAHLGGEFLAAQGGGDTCAVISDPEVEHSATPADQSDLRAMMERVLGVLGSDGTVANIAREELEAYEAYKERKAAGVDYSVALANWKDLTKTKREWMKTPDAVEVALKALKFWVRGEWEQEWKTLRTALDGRRLGMDAREELLATGDDELEWRRVWDMEMERVIADVLGDETE